MWRRCCTTCCRFSVDFSFVVNSVWLRLHLQRFVVRLDLFHQVLHNNRSKQVELGPAGTRLTDRSETVTRLRSQEINDSTAHATSLHDWWRVASTQRPSADDVVRAYIKLGVAAAVTRLLRLIVDLLSVYRSVFWPIHATRKIIEPDSIIFEFATQHSNLECIISITIGPKIKNILQSEVHWFFTRESSYCFSAS